ncbi:MAG: helix-turn-helix transcriptional regulator [Rhodocyclaceae bacterium]|nr:helix-turn-helix transcriptional regulator [Rhodocyclaceae bacterium]
MSQLKQLRIQRGLKARAVAAQAQISPGYLSRLERGQVGMSVDTARRLAAVLSVEPADLMFPERMAS